MSILVTVRSGFIGSNFVLDWLAFCDEATINTDNLTLAGKPENLAAQSGDERYVFVKSDICDPEVFSSLREKNINHARYRTLQLKVMLIGPSTDQLILFLFVSTVVTINFSNHYGPFQFSEKLIPLFITIALAGKPLPDYGDGQRVLDWLDIKDRCSAVRRVLERCIRWDDSVLEIDWPSGVAPKLSDKDGRGLALDQAKDFD